MSHLRFSVVVLIGLICPALANAVNVVKEFSATAVQRAPGRPEFEARMYVSKQAVRTDYRINGTEVIQIVYPKKHTQILMVPKDKIYTESENSKSQLDSKSPHHKPCDGMRNTECKSLGKESINGRETEKWEFLTKHNGQTFRSLHWIDVKRHMPIREFMPDGTVTELKIVGTEKINGRESEKWSFQITRADGKSVTSTQWYDPEIGIATREQMPGGYLRELRDIKTGKQAPSLFVVPKGFHLVKQLPAYLMPPHKHDEMSR